MGAGIFMALGCMVGLGGLLGVVDGVFKALKDEERAWLHIAIGSVFIIMGFALLWLGVSTSREVSQKTKLVSRFPDEPWKWNPEWRDGVIKDSSTTIIGCLLVVTLIWNAFSWIGVTHVILENQFEEDKKAYLVFLFPFVGVLLVGVLVYQFLQWRKHGSSTLTLETFPGIIGSEFKARLSIPSLIRPHTGFEAKLESYKHHTNQRRESSTIVLWKTEKVITDWTQNNRTTEVSISFEIPPDQQETTFHLITDYHWGLTVKAEATGVDYFSQFEIPICNAR